ncbi:MAG: helix-hairpin-helix domain-containing protein [Nitrospirae bacterium]|nr:helix-hairpin-helix domain-containing protein [Nitrospirota bacterium]
MRASMTAAIVLCLLLGAWTTALAAGGQKKDINKASREELLDIKGIGDKRATAILRYIQEHGPVREMNELLRVRGVGEKTLEKIKEAFEVKDPPE